MARQKHLLSQDGLDKLQKEYDRLTKHDRPDVLRQMNEARVLGDLRENEAYHSARHKIAMIQGRIDELEQILNNATVSVTGVADGVITLGSVVEVEVNGNTITFTIVSEHEADVSSGRISTVSPIGVALLGAKVGDVVEFQAPFGLAKYLVKSVS